MSQGRIDPYRHYCNSSLKNVHNNRKDNSNFARGNGIIALNDYLLLAHPLLTPRLNISRGLEIAY
ncbi:MAG TPA: hypothetical protein VJZ75_09310 [Candidatus Bathyarchaeia archaeon]|nr:hypothetical protein [Candidatus Bathyarchaeia archaeon]